MQRRLPAVNFLGVPLNEQNLSTYLYAKVGKQKAVT